MSRAQTVSTLFTFAAAILALVLFLILPVSFWLSLAIAGMAFFIVSGIGHRYFLKHATPEEIRADLEERKDSPG